MTEAKKNKYKKKKSKKRARKEQEKSKKRARKEQQSFKVFTSDFNPKIWFNKSPKFVDRSKQTMYCLNVRGY